MLSDGQPVFCSSRQHVHPLCCCTGASSELFLPLPLTPPHPAPISILFICLLELPRRNPSLHFPYFEKCIPIRILISTWARFPNIVSFLEPVPQALEASFLSPYFFPNALSFADCSSSDQRDWASLQLCSTLSFLRLPAFPTCSILFLFCW